MTRASFNSFLYSVIFLAACMTAFAQPLPESTAQILTNAEQVHWLSRSEAAAGRQVRIRGVITCALPAFNAAVVQDGAAGIYVNRWDPPLAAPPVVGQLVEVEGSTDPGEFAPLVHAVRVTNLGTAELPQPVHPFWDQLINGSLDTEFVEFEGVLTEVRPDAVTLLNHDGKINVLVFGSDGQTNNLALKPYEGALVRLRGCLFASWDSTTHAVNVHEVRMFAPSVTVEEPAPADPFSAPPKRPSDLLGFDPQASALRRVKVSGQIVQFRLGEYFAMDGKSGFRFITKNTAKFSAGDLVEVVGFPRLTGPSPVLQEAEARKTGAAALPDPLPLDAGDLFRAENDALRVRVNALLLNVSGDRRTLELQAGLQRFVARLEDGELSRAGVPLGSRIELTGVYAGNGGSSTTGAEVASFELLLHSPSDIQVVTRPQFWTLRRLLALVAVLVGVLGLALVWIRLLHHKVQKRTMQLQKEARAREQAEQQRALAMERARIARDLHDDLGSSLTEIAMLATAGPGSELRAEEATERMETIVGKSRMLVHALDEIVWAVDPERDTLASVARYLASYAEEYLAGLKVACRVQIPNAFPDQVVSGQVRHHLFLAVKETLNNAVHHGVPSEVGFRIRVLEDRLWIYVADNGSGFNTAERSNGHGLLNIRSRLERLCGRCDVESSPGAGATVSLQVPLPVPANLS
jgi:signal transduction histidine kinase